MTLAILLIAAAVIGFFVWRSQTAWTTLAVASGTQSEDIQYKYNLLKDNGVRTKLKSSEAAGNVATSAPLMDEHAQAGVQYTLVVHKDDEEKARSVLEHQAETVI
ncbi:hypothetical protein J31TS4_33730 [Paenibacillus sp. J31TS4]|uniref:hypothetical protein n=1 Tax=Paenibacillus sp. J31TS4 TaxID=2807195 RepID=UPI001B26745F|nr:hypothetical protein [Paenibacillus sp. J31TS4]GIP40093.1 hypothetical protein J31TS4_33730 [Paenibacillus sp. J31TS4]